MAQRIQIQDNLFGSYEEIDSLCGSRLCMKASWICWNMHAVPCSAQKHRSGEEDGYWGNLQRAQKSKSKDCFRDPSDAASPCPPNHQTSTVMLSPDPAELLTSMPFLHPAWLDCCRVVSRQTMACDNACCLQIMLSTSEQLTLQDFVPHCCGLATDPRSGTQGSGRKIDAIEPKSSNSAEKKNKANKKQSNDCSNNKETYICGHWLVDGTPPDFVFGTRLLNNTFV
jgi:hypothetical protein